ncbi:hypothetical protein L7F22_003167 [Adiantum nelumboides]|nr:hypothetical protein [Adiantum nelumboides]
MSRRSSGSGSVPEDMYDGRHNVAIDSPISAADMLSKAARQKRRGTSGRSSVFDESQYARSSAGITPSKSTKRLFPDTPEVHRLGLTPTSRNHSQRKSKRARRSQYDEEEDERVNDTTISYRDRRLNAPTASTPYVTQRKQPIPNRASNTSGPSKRTSAGNVLRDNSQYRPEPSSSTSIQASQYFDSSSVTSQKREKPGWFAGWGTGKEESPMDILRRLAAAPGSLLSTPSSVLERLWGDSQSGTRRPDGSQSQQAAGSSSIGPTPSNSSHNQRLSTNAQQRRSMANTSAAISELGQARRENSRQSRVSTNLFANLASPENELNDITVPRNSLPDIEDRETELQRILAERADFAFPNSSNRTRQSVNMFNDLLEEEDESLAFEDKTDTPAPETFDQGEMQYEENPYEEEDIALPRQQESSRSVSDARSDSGQEEVEGNHPMRIPRGGYEELYNLESDSDSQEYLESSSEEDSDSDQDRTYRSKGYKKKSKSAKRFSVPKKRTVQTKKEDRISRLTNNPVTSMRSLLVRELFRKMVTPNVSVGAIPGPSKPKNSKSKLKKVALDEQVFKAVEDITHEFFVSLADSLRRHEYRDNSSRFITANVMVDLMKEKGILDSQRSLVSLARKMMPRELSDQLAPNLDKELDEDSDDGKYGMGNISAAVFNQEDFSSSVSELSQSGSEGSETETDYGEMGNVDENANRSGAVELLTYRKATPKGRSRESEPARSRSQNDRARDSSSLLSQSSTSQSRTPLSNRRRSKTRR